MKKILPVLYIPYRYLVFVPVVALSTAFFGTLAVVLLNFLKPRMVAQLTGVPWARFNSYITPMLLKVRGRENIDPKQSYVIVANHQSHFDIFVLYGWMGVDFKWVMKIELLKVPFIGSSCDKLEHIYIDRSNKEAALASLDRAKKRIVNGTSVIFFPEGTRSRSGEMGEFKKGAFRMALDLGLPLLPVTITGTNKILPPKTLRLLPGRAEMVIHPPIPVKGCTEKDIPGLMAEARQMITSGLGSRSG